MKKKKKIKKYVKLLRHEPICIVGASTRRKCILFLNPVKSLSILSSLAATKLVICRKWMTLHTIYSMVVEIPAPKGQLISKGLFSILNSPKKRKKEINFTTMILQVSMFSIVFREKLKTPRRRFQIN